MLGSGGRADYAQTLRVDREARAAELHERAALAIGQRDDCAGGAAVHAHCVAGLHAMPVDARAWRRLRQPRAFRALGALRFALERDQLLARLRRFLRAALFLEFANHRRDLAVRAPERRVEFAAHLDDQLVAARLELLEFLAVRVAGGLALLAQLGRLAPLAVECGAAGLQLREQLIEAAVFAIEQRARALDHARRHAHARRDRGGRGRARHP